MKIIRDTENDIELRISAGLSRIGRFVQIVFSQSEEDRVREFWWQLDEQVFLHSKDRELMMRFFIDEKYEMFNVRGKISDSLITEVCAALRTEIDASWAQYERSGFKKWAKSHA